MFGRIVVILFSVILFSTAKSSSKKNQSAHSDEPQLIFAHVVSMQFFVDVYVKAEKSVLFLN